MTADDTATNGTSEPKADETAPIEKDSETPVMEGSAKENGEPTPKASSPKKAKKGKKGKKGSKTEEKAPEGSATENGETKTEGDPDIEIIGEKKKKPIKKKIPHWATLSDSVAAMAAKGTSKAAPPGATGITVIIDAIKQCADSKGLASYILIKKFVQKQHPAWPKMTFKGALRRSVDKGRVKKIRNSYKVISEAPVEKKKPTVKVAKKLSKGRKTLVALPKEGPLEDLFPHIFTWVCEPKEASYGLIRKYIAKHYPKLSPDAQFKKAMANMVAKGQLDQITGKGASGTFALENGAKKTGTSYEDPIEDAIIASNEPKDASVTALRHYLAEFHTEYNVKDRPKVLKNALERAEDKGWLVRVTGKGFNGTFRLSYPYIPSPKDLWREAYVDPDVEKPAKKQKRKAQDDSSDEESSSEESESESEEEEVVPVSKRAKSKPVAKKSAPKKPASKKKSSKKSSPKKPAAKKSKYAEDSESEEESADEESAKEESEEEPEPEYVPKKGKRGAPSPRSAISAKKSKVAKKPPVTAKKSSPKKPVAKKSSPKKPAAKKTGGAKKKGKSRK